MVSAASTIRFQATLHEEGVAVLDLPREAIDRLSVPEGVSIEGTMNGFPFRAQMEGGALSLSESLQQAIGLKPGKPVPVEITRIGEEPEVLVPSDLREALDGAPSASALWKKITPMARREWVRWIASAKQQETRERRIEVGLDKLSKGMRRPCCFPGLNFVTKDLVPPEDTWVALPGSTGS